MSERIRRIIIPTPLQLLACLVIAATIVVAVYQSVVVPRLYQKVSVRPGDVSQAGVGVLEQLNQYSFVRTAVEVTFWALVGVVCYIIYLGITNAIIDARNEVIIDTEYANRGAMAKHVQRYGKQLVVAVGLVGLLVLAGWKLLPACLELIDPLFFNSVSLANIVAAVAGYLGLALTVYTIWMVAQLTFSADQL